MEELANNKHSLCLEIIGHIKANYTHFNDDNIEFEGDVEDPENISVNYVSFNFPAEDEYYEMSHDELVELASEIKSLEIVNNGLIKTTNRRYYIVSSKDTNHDHILKRFHHLKTVSKENIELNVVHDSFFVGLAATDLNEYDEDFWGTFSPYLAVEVIYKDNRTPLLEEQERDLVRSYIFEIADSTGIALDFSGIGVPNYDFAEYEEEGNYVDDLREVEQFNEGMRLFVSAIQIQEEELKFLNFYKILEYFAPIAVNIEANELMRKKLDAPRNSFQDGGFIRSIFALAKSMRDRFNDEDLIKSTFNLCFDFIGQFDKLPESIKKKVKKEAGFQSLSYSTDKQKVSMASNMVSKIIYTTRNKVVHAKSNYQRTGIECENDDLGELNEFMKEICSQTIRWYNRLPQHLKLTVVE